MCYIVNNTSFQAKFYLKFVVIINLNNIQSKKVIISNISEVYYPGTLRFNGQI